MKELSSFRYSLAMCATAALLAACGSNEPAEEKSDQETAIFRRVPSAESGVTFANRLEENYEKFFDFFAYVYNGGGVAIGDLNNDGLADIFFSGNEVPNRLYMNEGELKFRDITRLANVADTTGWNNGVTMADVNGDGYLDIYVCRGGWQDEEHERRNLLYVNQGDMTFKEQAEEFGLQESGYSIHASFFDMDNDNDLDVYITNRPDSFDLPLTQMVRQKKLSPTFSRDKLYRQDNGKFTEVGLQAGITNNFGYALSVVTTDLNNDGYTDIFVANDFAEGDYMYINQKNGTFKEQIKQATNHISMYSMGTDIADINNDGWEDIMVTEMLPEEYKRSKVSMPSMDTEGFYEIVNSGMHKQYMHNALHLNQGNMFFSEISQLSGVSKTEWSWSCLLSDFDNDGLRDLFVANGYKRDVFDGDAQQKLGMLVRSNMDQYESPNEMFTEGFDDIISVYEPIKVPNYVFRNMGDLRFEKVSDEWGLHEPSFSNGAAVGDLDNDGDLDLVINNIDEEAFVYENLSSQTNNAVRIKLRGPGKNTDGLGAKVKVYYNGKFQYFEQKTVRGYLSSNDPVVHFGVGDATLIDSVVVDWTDGRRTVVPLAPTDELVVIRHATSVPGPKAASSMPIVFTKSDPKTLGLSFSHQENIVDEYKDQILLPHMFSRSGPFMATGDVNNDGLEDLFVGGAAGQAGQLFVQKGGRFSRVNVAALEKDKAFEDMGVSFFDANGDGNLDIYVVSGGSEFEEGDRLYQDRLYLGNGGLDFTSAPLPPISSSGSVVVPFDVDGDGDVDIFRGGHVVKSRYPHPPQSYILVNENGTFTDKTESVAPDLSRVGMVTSAVAEDLNKDGKAELILVGEWMPAMIFESRDGKLSNASGSYGLEKTEGWWSRVVASDVDNDGDQDLILGNIGENYKFSASSEKPFQVYAKDFDGNGTNDIFLAKYYQDSIMVPIRGRECTSQQVPSIARRFPTYLSFAESDLTGILGSGMEDALHYKAHLFSSVFLINDGGRFTVRKLPVDAQLSSVNGIVVRDFDGDGANDLLIAGNKFDVEVETTPADASPGLFMKGEGNLRFTCRKPNESGFFVPDNAKDIKTIQMGDKTLVLVTVNNGPLKVFVVTGQN